MKYPVFPGKMMMLTLIFLSASMSRVCAEETTTETPLKISAEIQEQTKTFEEKPHYKLYSPCRFTYIDTTLLDQTAFSERGRKIVDSMNIGGHEFKVTEGYVPFSTNPMDTAQDEQLRKISARQVELGNNLFWSMEKGIGGHLSERIDITLKAKNTGGSFEINIPLGKRKH